MNEFTAETDNCDDINGTCTSTDGAFTCECNSGQSGDGDVFW